MNARPVVGYEGLYVVTSDGTVSSLDRYVAGRAGSERLVRGRVLIPEVRPDGHLAVQLWRENRGRKFSPHRLVLEAFVGPCPEGMECLHRNDVPADNRLENLRWGTRKENRDDARSNGIALGGRHAAMVRWHGPSYRRS